MSKDELLQRIIVDFAFHPANEARGSLHERARGICFDAASQLIDLVPEGRELSLALTKLEEAMMWANAGIARES